MISVDLTVGALIYLFSAVGLILALWFYADFRDKNLYETERKKVIFHCIKCDKIYSTKAGADTASCPRCGFTNARLKF